MNGRLFSDKATAGARQQAMVAFSDDLATRTTSVTAQLIENQTFIDAEGKIKSQTPASVFGQSLSTIIKKTLGFESLGSAGLSTAFYDKNENGESVLEKFQRRWSWSL